ncbi:MAG TPA: ATPase, T2SS/T4P/T4SS family [Acidimicrobiales bacterium]|nr:ATPase, T2SS/T4P/T4SS family [Acidimicrobiales bacterium]
MNALTDRLQAEVASRLADHARAPDPGEQGALTDPDRSALGRALIAEALQDEAAAALSAGRPVLDTDAEDEVAAEVFAALFTMAGFQRYLDDLSIENINANGCDEVFVRYADGTREQVEPVAASDKELVELIRTLAARVGLSERRFDLASPRLSLQLLDGSRLFAVMAVTGRPCVSIRRHRFPTLTLDDLVRLGTIDGVLRALLGACVTARKNLLVTGGTAAGKTTMLRALCAEISPAERLVTIEDSLELGLDRDRDGHPDVVAMQAREPNVEGEGEITQAELVRWALRMSPDRVLVGEIRGAEVIPMCNAMSQGNDGSMATLHASSSKGAFSRLATYAIQAPERLPLEATNLMVASAVDFVVHLGADIEGHRIVSSVREVIDADGPQVISNEIFRPDPDGRALPGVPMRSETLDTLMAAGFDPDVLTRGALDDPRRGWDR